MTKPEINNNTNNNNNLIYQVPVCRGTSVHDTVKTAQYFWCRFGGPSLQNKSTLGKP